MENASKALIIAGAILISIVLVSVGVIVVNSLNTDDAVTTMTQQEIQSFNAKFDSSTGNNKSGTVVRSLLSTIITNNTTYSTDTSKQVGIVLKDGISAPKDGWTTTAEKGATDSKSLTNLKNTIGTGTRYDVTAHYNENSGLIDYIEIKTH